MSAVRHERTVKLRDILKVKNACVLQPRYAACRRAALFDPRYSKPDVTVSQLCVCEVSLIFKPAL